MKNTKKERKKHYIKLKKIQQKKKQKKNLPASAAGELRLK